MTENGAIRRIICGICSAASLLLHHAPAVAALVFAGFSAAAEPSARFNDGIDRTDPNFVTASLLVMSPGDEIYSCAGHSILRLECPKFNLDYCFTYESESAKNRVFEFFRGKLKMGMFAIPTEKFLEQVCNARRGVMQYRLNLPPDAKQRLWKILDGRVEEGINLPYDYLKRGCAHACLFILREALSPHQMSVASWPERYRWTRREFGDDAVRNFPWTKFVLHTFMGSELDRSVSNYEKVIFSKDLLALLKTAKIYGLPIITGDGVELTKAVPRVHRSLGEKMAAIFMPFVVSCIIGGLSIGNVFVKSTMFDVFLLVVQSIIGLFLSYLLFFSNLPATDWNWLIVPFNLLPLVFWKWRQKWALWFAGVLVLWEIGMIAYPHRLTDPAYLVLVGAYVLMYARIGWKWNRAAMERRTAEPAGGRVSSRAAAEGGRKC